MTRPSEREKSAMRRCTLLFSRRGFVCVLCSIAIRARASYRTPARHEGVRDPWRLAEALAGRAAPPKRWLDEPKAEAELDMRPAGSSRGLSVEASRAAAAAVGWSSRAGSRALCGRRELLAASASRRCCRVSFSARRAPGGRRGGGRQIRP